MLNTDDFIKRLEFILEHYAVSASAFADKINVQRSSISHLLSGRNKPSLDFILKILDVFPELNLYWLLDGTGSFSKSENDESNLEKVSIRTTPLVETANENLANNSSKEKYIGSEMQNTSHTINSFLGETSGKQIEKIVFFYTDGTFKDYKTTS